MNLLQKIESDLKQAMKEGIEIKSSTLKMLKSDLTYEKAKTGEDLNDEKMLEVITRAAKRRREAIEEYRKAGREDLAGREESELTVIETYLPAQLDEKEIEKIIDGKLKSLGEVTQKDFGRVMGSIMKELKGQADGALVKQVLTRKLEGK